MRVFGHRGAAGHSPENTLSSMRRALELGVDGIEFDVRRTADGRVVVIHDETIDRTTSQVGRVADMTLQQLTQASGVENRISTLDEVLMEIGRQVRVNVELKEIQACEATDTVLRRLVHQGTILTQQVLITSFDLAAVKRARNLCEDWDVGLLTKGQPKASYWDLADELRATSANIDLESVSAEFVSMARRRGLQVMVYTVNSREDAVAMRQLGVDAIFSDYPDRVRS